MKLQGEALASIKKYAAQKAQEAGLDPTMFLAQLEQESGWNPTAVSSAGAKGLAQFMPGTAKQYKLSDPFNPEDSIDAATKYMSYLKKRYNGNEDLARQAYNWGEGNLDKHLRGKRAMPAETKNYNTAIYKIAGVAPPNNAPAVKKDTPASGGERPPIMVLTEKASQEMLAGAPPGAFVSQEMARNSWQEGLANVVNGGSFARNAIAKTPLNLPDSEYLGDAIQASVDEPNIMDAATTAQNTQLAKMFDQGLPDDNAQAMYDTLPPSIDRYLQKILES